MQTLFDHLEQGIYIVQVSLCTSARVFGRAVLLDEKYPVAGHAQQQRHDCLIMHLIAGKSASVAPGFAKQNRYFVD